MGTSFEKFFDELSNYDEITYADNLLHKMSTKLDVGTVRHSRRTAFGVALVAHAAKLDFADAVPLVAGAQTHDVGKHACLDVILSESPEAFSHDYNKYRLRRHPHDSYVLTKSELLPLKYSRMAAVHALTHHTYYRSRLRNYPSDNALQIYVDANEFSEEMLLKSTFLGPFIAHNDVLDAISHPSERPYMASNQLYSHLPYQDLVDKALVVCERDLVSMPFEITPKMLGSLVLQHQEQSVLYSEHGLVTV